MLVHYHLSVKYVSRKQGRSSIAAAAYRSCERLHNKQDGKTHDFTNKRGTVYKEILLPEEAPPEFYDRETLWNAVELSEKRSNSRTAREIEISLPIALTLDEQIELVQEYANENFVSRGMCADISFHSGHRKNQRDTACASILDNPHAHILLTTRSVDEKGFGKKIRQWDKRENVELWRSKWTDMQNREFNIKNFDIRVRHESYERQGIDREPTKYLEHRVTALERRGIYTRRGDENRAIEKRNNMREIIKEREIKYEKHDRDLLFERKRKRSRER